MSYMGKVRPTVALTSSDIVDGAITTDKLVDDAVTSAKIDDGTIATADIADDAVTVDKVANAINTSIAANTSKVTNATHTGDVTGATALTIATDAVDIAMLSATGTADSTTFLRGDNAWSAPSGGGLKFISDTDFSGTASHFDVTDCFSATYRSYLVVMDSICVQLENASLYFYLGNSDLSSTENTSWELQMLGTNGTTDYKAAYGTGGQQLVYQQHNSNMGLSGTLWIHNPFGTGIGYITYTHGSGQVYANGTAEGFWFPRFAASHGTASVPSMRLSCAGGMGNASVTGHVLIYGLAES